ncbi:MAG: homocysteine S-methyltransferase family protein [Dehalococcoidia bacterium]
MVTLQEKIDSREVIILDGAIGTELERMGVPMDDAAWCASALKTHPDTVRQLHEDYIRAGADIITTNTFSSARHSLDAAGLGDLVRELNTRAVTLAQEARDNVAGDRPIYIAGSISNYGATGGTITLKEPSAKELRNNYREQAELLAEAGVDLLVLEMMMNIERSKYALEAALTTGLPTWVGFSCRVDDTGAVLLWPKDQETELRHIPKTDVPFAQGLGSLMALGGSAVTIMHSEVEDIAPALRVAMERWHGPVGAYPNSGYWKRPNWQFVNVISPQDYLVEAQKWVQMGVQIIGGCCGIGREYIKVLREGLPTQLPTT